MTPHGVKVDSSDFESDDTTNSVKIDCFNVAPLNLDTAVIVTRSWEKNMGERSNLWSVSAAILDDVCPGESSKQSCHSSWAGGHKTLH